MLDYNGLWERYEAEAERRISRLPLCCGCAAHITDEKHYYLDDGTRYCPSCMEDKWCWTDDDDDVVTCGWCGNNILDDEENNDGYYNIDGMKMCATCAMDCLVNTEEETEGW